MSGVDIEIKCSFVSTVARGTLFSKATSRKIDVALLFLTAICVTYKCLYVVEAVLVEFSIGDECAVEVSVTMREYSLQEISGIHLPRSPLEGPGCPSTPALQISPINLGCRATPECPLARRQARRPSCPKSQLWRRQLRYLRHSDLRCRYRRPPSFWRLSSSLS